VSLAAHHKLARWRSMRAARARLARWSEIDLERAIGCEPGASHLSRFQRRESPRESLRG
jgi:hypothetical protein